MWQRIQTLYFAIIVALLAALALGNVATIIVPGSEPESVAYLAKPSYAVLIIVALLANLISLFSWGHRSLQIRLAGLAAVVVAALQIWLAVDYFTMGEQVVFKWTIIFPLIALIFEILAIRGIYADELLVRSASRLRAAKRAKNNNNTKTK